MSYYNFAELGDLERTLFTQKHYPCVFISHKKEDEVAAIAIASAYLSFSWRHLALFVRLVDIL